MERKHQEEMAIIEKVDRNKRNEKVRARNRVEMKFLNRKSEEGGSEFYYTKYEWRNYCYIYG